jgi:hypothetical protein
MNMGRIGFMVLAVLALAPAAIAVDHTRSAGEPYALAGKRLVFTNWYYIRPGQIDWLDASGKSVYGDSKTKAGPDEAHFDNYLAPRGIRLVAQPAHRSDAPIMAREKPWEMMGINAATLMSQDGKLRLWAGSQSASGDKFSCYFESSDGKTWTRPTLGLIEYEGDGKQNNLFNLPGSYVFFDTDAPEAERYKTIWAGSADPKAMPEYRKTRPISAFAEEEQPGRFHAILAAVSPDGFRWTELPQPISVEVSDTQIVAYRDPVTKKYVMFTRTQMYGPRAAGATRPAGRMHDFIGRRAIGRSESDDFRAFPLSQLILQPEAERAPTDTYYTNCKTTIPGAPDQHLLFPAIYHQADDTTSVELFSSNDSKTWTRLPGSPVLATNTPGKFDGGCVFAHPSLVELPNGDWALPYTGYVYPHKYPRGAWGYDVGLARWPKGRLIALEAPERGEFTTVAFIPPGAKVSINAVTERAGSIRVEACDVDAKPLPGRTFDDAVAIVGDQYHMPLKWKGGDDLGTKAGVPIVLRFRLDHASLFGLNFE